MRSKNKFSRMAEFTPLADMLFRERVLEARRMTPEEKFLAGEQLFDYACAIALEAIKNQFPDLSPADWQRILRERVELGERLERIV